VFIEPALASDLKGSSTSGYGMTSLSVYTQNRLNLYLWHLHDYNILPW